MTIQFSALSKHLVGFMMQVTECKYFASVLRQELLACQGVICAHMPYFCRPGHKYQLLNLLSWALRVPRMVQLPFG